MAERAEDRIFSTGAPVSIAIASGHGSRCAAMSSTRSGVASEGLSGLDKAPGDPFLRDGRVEHALDFDDLHAGPCREPTDGLPVHVARPGGVEHHAGSGREQEFGFSFEFVVGGRLGGVVVDALAGVGEPVLRHVASRRRPCGPRRWPAPGSRSGRRDSGPVSTCRRRGRRRRRSPAGAPRSRWLHARSW